MTMNKYRNGKIYLICSRHTEQVYVGSTTKSLGERLYSHENGYEWWKRTGINYMSSYEILKLGGYYIYHEMDAPCNSRNELLEIEEEVRLMYDSEGLVVNQNKAWTGIDTSDKKAYMKELNRRRRQVKMICVCGFQTNKSYISTHQKSKLHAGRMQLIEWGLNPDFYKYAKQKKLLQRAKTALENQKTNDNLPAVHI